eukprot:scaffold15508_cov66-Cyclotella_meneghiniana.AAC.7
MVNVEKFAACDTQGKCASSLYHIAAHYLQKKGYADSSLIEQLKTGSFGFSSQRPLLWLWRFSSRQRKEVPSFLSTKARYHVDWQEIFHDPHKPLVVDIGSGMGASLLNLAILNSTSGNKAHGIFNSDGTLQMPWTDCNYAGAELNQAMVNFGNGIISRDTSLQRKGRVHFFCIPAEQFLDQLGRYPGKVVLIMINFPSPYRLENGDGNSQLPFIQSGQFMVTKKVLQLITSLLSRSQRSGIFLFQTKCEDVAVHVTNECYNLGMGCVNCKNPVRDIDLQYARSSKRPKRVNEWLQTNPLANRAEGNCYSSSPFLLQFGQPETEAQCTLDNTVVHRCLYQVLDRSES